jgi:hypothetical protein
MMAERQAIEEVVRQQMDFGLIVSVWKGALGDSERGYKIEKV